ATGEGVGFAKAQLIRRATRLKAGTFTCVGRYPCGARPRRAPMATANQRTTAGSARSKGPGTSPASGAEEQGSDPPALSISREKVCFIVVKAREFDVKDLPTFPDD